jgi:DNA repair exonuclease SbcCD nuclease subunit
MKKPYALISDTHNHNWSAFSSVNPTTGINTRLQATLNEFGRASKAVFDAGGIRVYHAGDLFHVRGSVAPSVFNPTRGLLESYHKTRGTDWVIDAGNHDLEGKHSTRLGNAVEMLRSEAVQVASEPELFLHADGVRALVVPWHDSVAALRITLEAWAKKGDPANTDLIIHAPIDGVIMGIPDHGLDAGYLASLGFKRVFAGHYHNHKDFGNGVYSIGALTHQTWSDVDSKAGFLIVHDDKVEWHETTAPKFVDIHSGLKGDEVKRLAPGNFVRLKVKSGTKSSAIAELRDYMEKGLKAAGVRIDVVKEPTRIREGTATVKAGASVEVSIGDYIKAKGIPHAERVHQDALKVLTEAA